MNIFIICFVPAQILYLGKILFMRCRPKYSQPIKLHNFSMNYFSIANLANLVSELYKVYYISRINCFFACWYKFMQVKMTLKILGVGVIKNGFGQSCNGTLKLALSEE